LLRNFDHGGFDGLKNLEIASATAKDAGKSYANLIPTYLWMLIQQRFCSDQNRGRAVSALRRTEIGEGVLERMKIPFQSEAFDGQHIPRVALDSEDQAGKHGLAIQKDRAGTALSELTAMLRPGVAEVFAKDFEQRLVGRERDVNLLTVQGYANVRCFLRCDRQCDHAQSPLGKSSGFGMTLRVL
jgi:hypothetical protein